jgi:hypothetical protein
VRALPAGRILVGGGIGRSAVRGLGRRLGCMGAVGDCVACWMTAGVGGLTRFPSFIRAGVTRNCDVSV